MSLTFGRLRQVYEAWKNKPKDLAPQTPLPACHLDIDKVLSAQSEPNNEQVTWLGHSSFLLQMAGKTLLLDPVFSNHASPLPWTVRRFKNSLPANLDKLLGKLTTIDAVFISHNHYDHLDHATIKKLTHKVACFYVPLGVDSHLRAWGVPADRIYALDWWQKADGLAGIDATFVPARHSSGRALSDQKATLWGAWVLGSALHQIFFSGDGGYGKHFGEIGTCFGGFDLVLMECGQYNPNWKDVHMTPEESHQAALDVGARAVLPIHWGSFALSTHSWVEPVERLLSAVANTNLAADKPLVVATPKTGQTLMLGNTSQLPQQRWWRAL